jgi:predicted RNA binding protein YcfA (HicA-like mRNA interferase family)
MKKNELVRILMDHGCYLLKQGTNHEIWLSPINGQTFLVPRHGAKELASGTAAGILKQSGIKTTKTPKQ